MKIVILAAGIGSRLGNPFPKPLTPLKNGKSIMQMMIENIDNYFCQHDVYVVVGFKKNSIMENFPQLAYIYNPYFDQTNTAKSLVRALKKCKGESVLWFNGDVVFDEKLLDNLQPHIDKDISFVAVNTNSVGDEEVKYTLKDGFVNQLSKEVKNGLGEAVGVNFISKNNLTQYIERLEECDNNDYFERGLELLIEKDNAKVKAVDISAFNCMEIDFQEDLENVNKFL
ncbi:phosphocholine cytidylyltransferase family protein [Marixanthomonas sp. SCSIO 43207]|uniref:phosphocholine cytidylyltransferase family protein n=1 Tax=Marixanthomonas sp. SCSIO 43207 TaxID=2779360 RepID=UPI001CA9B765|nr:phosphocholine cytidylyltransferase family protein [Marixanthomonas sp. SCSIO 43207]UAB81082.1 phosphocholine cytidylyltransferase family protein [Marixanthomonas sp. SCSIO 43207]